MTTETNVHVPRDEEAPAPILSAAGSSKARPPADFIYDGGQIILELLQRRAEEEDRLRFITALRRLDCGRAAAADF